MLRANEDAAHRGVGARRSDVAGPGEVERGLHAERPVEVEMELDLGQPLEPAAPGAGFGLVFDQFWPMAVIGVVTLASHRYGPAVGGILGAVPAKGGPILIFLALDQGTSFAATAAAAPLAGTIDLDRAIARRDWKAAIGSTSC